MSIYAILASKPHNPHYLNRYIRFIESCRKVNENYTGYTEKHHICPKAKELFPEYKSFSEHPWNKALLTARQHFIAHWILWKAYPDNQSMMFAFWNISSTKNTKSDSRTYSKLREEVSNKSHFRGGEIQRKTARKRLEDGTHHFLGGELARKRVEDGTHHLLGGEIQRKRVENGTHHFLDKEAARKRELKKVKEGTHHFLDENYQKKIQEFTRRRVEDGTHHLVGGVTCIDKNGNVIQIPKEVYHNQSGEREQWVYVATNSKEGRKRRGKIRKDNNTGLVPCVDLQGNVVRITKEVFNEQCLSDSSREFVHVTSKEAKRRKLKRINEECLEEIK